MGNFHIAVHSASHVNLIIIYPALSIVKPATPAHINMTLFNEGVVMKKLIQTCTGLFIIAAALGLAACGGSDGGGNGGFTPPDIPHQPIAITPDNESTVSQSAFDGANGGTGLGTNAIGFLGAVSAPQDGAVGSSLFTTLKGLLDTTVDRGMTAQGGTATVTGVQYSGSSACGYQDPFTNEMVGSGTESYTINVAAGFDEKTGDPITITAGDYISSTFDNCDYGDGDVQNGSVSITFNSDINTGDLTTDNYSASITFSFDNFRVTHMGMGDTVPTTETLHGAITLSIVANGTNVSFDMSGSSFYASSAEENIHLTDFSFSATSDGTNSTIEASFTLASTALQGQITVDSYIESSGGAYPTSGFINITGDNSELDIAINGDGTVNITLLTNGVVADGYPKNNVTWEQAGIVASNTF